MSDLTERESQVLEQLALTGGTDRDIGQELGIAPRTVATYIRMIHAKIDGHIRTRGALIVWAWSTGWVYAQQVVPPAVRRAS